MKTKEKNKTFDKSLILELREIRDRVSAEIRDMDPDQLKQYLAGKQTLHPTAVWRKQD